MNIKSITQTSGPAAMAQAMAAPGSAARAVDLPGLRPSRLVARRRRDDMFEDWPVFQPDELEDWDSEEEAIEETPEEPGAALARTLAIAMPRRQYFAQLVERLPQSGFEFADLDLIRETIEITRYSQHLDRRCRISVRLFGCGETTGLVFAVERPELARFHAEKHLYHQILAEMEAILLSAIRQDREAKRDLALRLMAELDETAAWNRAA